MILGEPNHALLMRMNRTELNVSSDVITVDVADTYLSTQRISLSCLFHVDCISTLNGIRTKTETKVTATVGTAWLGSCWHYGTTQHCTLVACR